MADPNVFTPADPALIEAIKHPEPKTDPALLDAAKYPKPTLTEDPAKIAALNRQAAAMEKSAAGVQAMAGIDSTPYPDHEVYLRARLSALQAGQYTAEGAAHGAALAVLRDYKAAYPA